MKQIESFKVEGTQTKDMGSQIKSVVNPFLAAHPEATIESVNVDMSGSFHKALVIVSYDAPPAKMEPRAMSIPAAALSAKDEPDEPAEPESRKSRRSNK